MPERGGRERSHGTGRGRGRRGKALAWGWASALLLLSAHLLQQDVCAEGTTAGAADHFSFFDGWPNEPYPLDSVPRFLGNRRRVRCETADLVTYRGTHLRYARPVRVRRPFVERLARFEALVQELALEHYGRPPRRVVHSGGYSCRRARGRRARISEHALGNALDLRGFDFGPLPRGARLAPGAPRRLRRSFQVRVREHWSPRRRRDAIHAAFLHRLAETLRARSDIFRGIVGPPRPRHRDHLHLDAAPWRYAMFGYSAPEPSPD